MKTALSNNGGKQIQYDTVSTVVINEHNAQQRLDNFLLVKLKGAPKSLIYKIIRTGQVRVNKKRATARVRLNPGDIVRIPPIKSLEQKNCSQVPGKRFSALIESSVLFEDNDIILVNKPAGIAVHGGSGINIGLIEALRKLRPEKHFMELVHRIDKETSGCLLIATKRSVLRHIHNEIRERRVCKAYQLLAAGCWITKNKQTVNLPLKKNVLSSGERIVTVSDQGKAARTWFKSNECFADCTLLSAKLDTGRTHQIRVHAKSCGHPIAGDEKYGSTEFNSIIKKKYGIKRLMLHASQLGITMPSGEFMQFSAPLPEDFASAIAIMKASVQTRA
ncbi:MAG: RluA family pseudouridine synthase [Endozoicomonadaceae bacterium]|nr:RluA family pseudouridine synthase [Endozoicomonadaceae bacterium]MCY4329295.1 RluA family pseudouridine synthase [Endozoicomonadaceae bacterium]